MSRQQIYLDELKDFIKHNNIEIAVLTIPKEKAIEMFKEFNRLINLQRRTFACSPPLRTRT